MQSRLHNGPRPPAPQIEVTTSHSPLFNLTPLSRQIEVLPGKDGENHLLINYQGDHSLTDLLMVHKSQVEAGKDIPQYECGY